MVRNLPTRGAATPPPQPPQRLSTSPRSGRVTRSGKPSRSEVGRGRRVGGGARGCGRRRVLVGRAAPVVARSGAGRGGVVPAMASAARRRGPAPRRRTRAPHVGGGHAPRAGSGPRRGHACSTTRSTPSARSRRRPASARAHVELSARQGAAGTLRLRLAGERVQVAGRFEALGPAEAHELAKRHVRGRLTVASVDGWSAGDPASRAANRIHRALADGAAVMPPAERALFLGFVLGDDRDQSPAVPQAFRDSGPRPTSRPCPARTSRSCSSS